MNTNYLALGCYLGICGLLYGILSAAPGCLDNSWHLTQMFDHKEYHYVDCNCPCEKRYAISAHRGQCSKCGHYRDPIETDIIKKAHSTAPSLLLKKPTKPLHLYTAGGCAIKKNT